MPRPNIVFLIADQHRWDFMGYEHNGVTHTPHLDRLAAAGTTFGAAYCTAPLCSPARAALASGRYGLSSGSYTNLHQLPAGTPGFVPQLRAAGYRTCAIGKTHMEIHAYDSDLTSFAHREYMDSLGWDEVCEISGNGMLKTGIRCAYSEFLREQGRFAEVLAFYQGWHYFMEAGRTGDPDFACHEWPLPEEYHETHFVGQRAVDWLQASDPAQPFLLHVGFAAPHGPVEPLPTFLDLYREAPEPDPVGVTAVPELTVRGRRATRAMVSEIDHWVGQIYAALAAQGRAENTIFVYTSDHGCMAGDRGEYDKTCFFEGAVRVPLLFAGPGVRARRRVDALVETLDLGRTLCDLCDVPAHALDQGQSLAPVLTGASDQHRDTVYCEMGCDRMVRDGRYKLMLGDPHSDTRKLGRLHLDKPVTIPPSPTRLYDLQEDPHELCDLADEPAYHAVRIAMTEKLLARINAQLRPLPGKSRGAYRPLPPSGS